MKNFSFYRQTSRNECGIVCMKMIFSHWGKHFSTASIREKVQITSEGFSIKQLIDTIEKFHCRAQVFNLPIEKLDVSPLPCIIPWESSHFVVLLEVNFRKKRFLIADPARKIISISISEFRENWSQGTGVGTGIFLEPTPEFYHTEESQQLKLIDFAKYLLPNKKFLFQLAIGLLINFAFALILPFFGQAIIDTGIKNRDLSFINVILMAQLVLFVSRSLVDLLRNWIVLHLSYKVNLASISDYIRKTLNLPFSYYSSYSIGDITQRMGDYSRIESFISNLTIGTLFTFILGFVFTFVLISYNISLFYLFFFFNVISLLWMVIFLNRRKRLDIRAFEQNAKNNSKVIEIISNALDIKVFNLHNIERYKWEELQYKIFGITKEQTILRQTQGIGGGLINELKNLGITFLSAKLVVSGDITLGMMFSVQYILGQIQAPFNQLRGLINGYQDAKISLQRLSDINDAKSEEESINGKVISTNYNLASKSIKVSNLSFKYDTSSDFWILDDINISVEPNSYVAIVGLSGSGKSTLLKILLKLYKPSRGNIRLDELDFFSISNNNWRSYCACVLQESTIFAGSIIDNVCLGEVNYDIEKIQTMCRLVNLDSLINDLPQKYYTLIGGENLRLSQGQKQRILIARALYRDPKYLFLDEATNSLDSYNEAQILRNIKSFRKDITIVAVAHRISTIKDADQIIILENGKIIEVGNHTTLLSQDGRYNELFKIQSN